MNAKSSVCSDPFPASAEPSLAPGTSAVVETSLLWSCLRRRLAWGVTAGGRPQGCLPPVLTAVNPGSTPVSRNETCGPRCRLASALPPATSFGLWAK